MSKNNYISIFKVFERVDGKSVHLCTCNSKQLKNLLSALNVGVSCKFVGMEVSNG